MDHDYLVHKAYRWCIRRCGFVFREFTAAVPYGEIPDVIGFSNEGTFLIEAKTSRKDFFADRNKLFRKFPEKGMGDWRFFITDKGLVNVSELPYNWGLLEVGKGGRVKVVYNPYGKGNILSSWFKSEKSRDSEWRMMYSALRRFHLRGLMERIYDHEF